MKDGNQKPPLIHPKAGERGMNELHYSAYSADMKGVVDSINKGIDINSIDDSGYTALHWLCDMAATGAPRMDILKILLENGVDVNIKSKTGETAISLALSSGSIEGDTMAKELESAAVKASNA